MLKNKYTQYFLVALLFLVLALFMIAVQWSFQYVYGGYDIPYHVSRMVGLANSLNYGTFPYYVNDAFLSGYGYAEALFYPVYTMLPAAWLVNAGVNWVTSYQAPVILYTVLTGLVTYYCVFRVTKNKFGALVTAILFTFCQYRMTDIFVRAAISEGFAFLFVPVIFWGGYEIIFGDYKKYWYIIGLGFTGLVLTHLLSVVMVGIFFALTLLFFARNIWREKMRFAYLCLAALLCILLSAFFVVPMMEQFITSNFIMETKPMMSSIQVLSGMEFLNGFSLYGYSESRMGFGFVLLILLCLRPFIRKWPRSIKMADFFLAMGVVALFMTTRFFPWNIFPFTKLVVIQFAWRFWFVASFAFALSGGIYLAYLCKEKFVVKAIMVAAVVAVVMAEMTFVSGVYQERLGLYTRLNEEILDKYHIGYGEEYLPSMAGSVKAVIDNHKQVVAAENPDVDINNVSNAKGHLQFEVNNVTTSEVIQIPRIYYLGYAATLNGEPIPVGHTSDGLVTVTVDAPGQVDVYYGGTVIQKVSLIVSGVTLVGFSGYLIWVYLAERKNSDKKARL